MIIRFLTKYQVPNTCIFNFHIRFKHKIYAVVANSVGIRTDGHDAACVIPFSASSASSKTCDGVDLQESKITPVKRSAHNIQTCGEKKLKQEDDETKNLSTAQMQRLVLLEQYKLIKMQIKKEQLALERLEYDDNIN